MSYFGVVRLVFEKYGGNVGLVEMFIFMKHQRRLGILLPSGLLTLSRHENSKSASLPDFSIILDFRIQYTFQYFSLFTSFEVLGAVELSNLRTFDSSAKEQLTYRYLRQSVNCPEFLKRSAVNEKE